MNIRYAEEKDITKLLELMNEFYSESDHEVNNEKAIEVFKYYIDNNSVGNIFLAIINKEVIGYLIVKYCYTMSNYGYVCSFEDLYINNKHRRLKAGLSLIQAAIAHASSKGIKNYNVEVDRNNIVAIKLYEKYGFKMRNSSIKTMEREEI